MSNSRVILEKKERSVMDLRERIKAALEYHLSILESDEELSPKDRIELVGRLLPFGINKITADKESSLPSKQGDPLAGY